MLPNLNYLFLNINDHIGIRIKKKNAVPINRKGRERRKGSAIRETLCFSLALRIVISIGFPENSANTYPEQNPHRGVGIIPAEPRKSFLSFTFQFIIRKFSPTYVH